MAVQQPPPESRNREAVLPPAQTARDESAHHEISTARGFALRGKTLAKSVLLPSMRPSPILGYAAAVAGVALVSCCLALVTAHVHIENISLLYLLLVLLLASKSGRGPAVLASVLAFLAYDFFFIPPFHKLTVDDPTEWVSLFALLATSLVLGQLTATVQARAHEAIASEHRAVASEQKAVASEQRTATLYDLAQLLVTSDDSTRLYAVLAQRVVEVFQAAGVVACVLLLPDDAGGLTRIAASPASGSAVEALDITNRENASEALWALTKCAPVGKGMPAPHTHGAGTGTTAHYFVPLKAGPHAVGVLGVAGDPGIRALALRTSHRADVADAENQQTGLRELFTAFCDQIALSVERASLRQRAIHAEVLQESDRLKNALLGSVTHDLRTPLASIKAATSSLLQPEIEWTAEDRRELLASIDTSADRLNRLVSNLLDLSRLEAGAAVPAMDWYLISDVIATVLDQLDLAGITRAYTVIVDVPEDLPLVPMDYGQIEQVLTNLIENATKYSPIGSEIRIQARALPSSELEVRVSDQGVGIPPGELRAIFDKFYRVQHVQLPWATGRPPIGTGLGLAISASIIQAHGGRIWAESQPGAGASFMFTLPIPADHPRGALPELAAPASRVTESESAPATPAAGSISEDVPRSPAKEQHP